MHVFVHISQIEYMPIYNIRRTTNPISQKGALYWLKHKRFVYIDE